MKQRLCDLSHVRSPDNAVSRLAETVAMTMLAKHFHRSARSYSSPSKDGRAFGSWRTERSVFFSFFFLFSFFLLFLGAFFQPDP